MLSGPSFKLERLLKNHLDCLRFFNLQEANPPDQKANAFLCPDKLIEILACRKLFLSFLKIKYACASSALN